MGAPLVSICMIMAVVINPQQSSARELSASAQLSSTTNARSNDKKGRAAASSALMLTEGNGSVSSSASALAFKRASSTITEKVQEILVDFPARKGKSDHSYCKDLSSSLHIDAMSAAEVAAKANVETLSSVEIDGTGKGCATSIGKVSAQVTTFAQTIVKAWAEAKGIKNVSSAYVTIDGTVTALAEAVATASADACTQSDGTKLFFSEAYQSVVAEAYTKAFVTILAWLEAYVDCSGGTGASATANVNPQITDDKVSLTSTGDTLTEGKGSATTSADGHTQADQVYPCDTIQSLSTCCQGRNLLHTQCFCNLPRWKKSDPICKARRIEVEGKHFWDYSISGQGGICSC